LRSKLLFTAILLSAHLAASCAHADCSMPDGIGGDLIYNKDHFVLQYCNDKEWIGLGAQVQDPRLTNLTPNKFCGVTSGGGVVDCSLDASILSVTLGQLGDVNLLPPPSNGQALIWNGTEWAPGSASADAAGNDGSIQFNLGSSLAADAANLHWDNTNKRLGIGTTTPTSILYLKAPNSDAAAIILEGYSSAAGHTSITQNNTAGAPGYSVWRTTTNGAAGMDIAYVHSSGKALIEVGGFANVGGDGAPQLAITSTGNVGIGTTTPASKLQVAGGIQLADDADACPGTGNVKVGTLRFNSGALQICVSGGWSGIAAGSVTAAGNDGSIQFSTGSSLAADAANLHWDNTNKRLGIGTNSPSSTLDVTGDLGLNGNISLKGGSTETRGIEIGVGRSDSGYAYVDLIGDTTDADNGLRLMRENTGPNANSYIRHRGTGLLLIRNEEAGPIRFDTSATERMRITPDGNVGIGTANPQRILHLAHTNVSIALEDTDGTANERIPFINSNAGLLNFGFFYGQLCWHRTYGDDASRLLWDWFDEPRLSPRSSKYSKRRGPWPRKPMGDLFRRSI